MDTLFAVVQIGGPVFGIGRTEGEAVRDAAEYANDGVTLADPNSRTVGDMVILPATERLYYAVEADGGDVPWGISDGVVVL